ncbi:MAG: DUF1638 domain-containing protein [Alphaproteobacteria bacterium]|nr:DUF1638 domain-containing protein [Alphaproteobacteria bacterium]
MAAPARPAGSPPGAPLRTSPPGVPPRRQLVLACGALAREVMAVLEANGLGHVAVRCLPASLHNDPKAIPGAVRAAVRESRAAFDDILVGYADCGTGGQLDALLQEEGLERLPGAHCYAFYAGVDAFAARAEADMRAFFLTDFLARQFETLVIEGLGLDRHPELRDAYFGHYETIVYLAQTDDAALTAKAQDAARRLGLAFERRFVGLGDLAPAIRSFAAPAATAPLLGAR